MSLKEADKKNIELIKQVFKLEQVDTKQIKKNILGDKKTIYSVPAKNFEAQMKNLKILKIAAKAGLVEYSKKEKIFSIDSEILAVRSDDAKKFGKKQFFKFKNNERTTLHDALQTVKNVNEFAEGLGLNPADMKYTVRHEDGDPEKVLNYVTFDASIFGNSEEEISKNVERINKLLMLERRVNYGTTA